MPATPMGAMNLNDPGLQPQRTVLAWNRTCLALMGNALLILRSGLLRQSHLILTLGALVMVLSAVTLLLAHRRHHLLLRGGLASMPGRSVVSRAIPWLAATCGVATAGALLAILLPATSP
ncbi:DUF202 domain-containing protein [Kerstersia similis]|uniref:DUF202 domain-containing protein n=1 Tax=Kerstersia similis TaxID=206505 RepID=UPI0039EEE9BD